MDKVRKVLLHPSTVKAKHPAPKMQSLWPAIARINKTLLPVLMAMLLGGGAALSTPVSTPANALAASATLTILSGNVEVILPGMNEAQPGIDGMTLEAGAKVKTSPDGAALVTFFDGSTLRLEPDTEVEIEELNGADSRQPISIVLKQWLGRTWSHVVKMVDRASHYEIKTPSAVALVRGTQFLTEVDDGGTTTVLTTEGLVSVSGEGKEIFVPVGQQTDVKPGTVPSPPKAVDVSKYVKTPEKVGNASAVSAFKHLSASVSSIPANAVKDGNGGQFTVTTQDDTTAGNIRTAASNTQNTGQFNSPAAGNPNSSYGNSSNNGNGNANPSNTAANNSGSPPNQSNTNGLPGQNNPNNGSQANSQSSTDTNQGGGNAPSNSNASNESQASSTPGIDTNQNQSTANSPSNSNISNETQANNPPSADNSQNQNTSNTPNSGNTSSENQASSQSSADTNQGGSNAPSNSNASNESQANNPPTIDSNQNQSAANAPSNDQNQGNGNSQSNGKGSK